MDFSRAGFFLTAIGKCDTAATRLDSHSRLVDSYPFDATAIHSLSR